MKATGIVRRIDDLGRVVIPKEIRRILRIREGDPLEIYTEKDGEVIFKKYSPVGELTDHAGLYAETLSRTTGLTAFVTDKDSVTAASGAHRKEIESRRIGEKLEELINDRRPYVYRAGDERIGVGPGAENLYAGIVHPLICDSDLIGAFVLLLPENGAIPSEGDVKVVSSAAQLFVRQLEF